tara:strand:- start:5897 stop:7036 length:1140 start_codon:yes stop_codon:yes gene_type:complete
MFRKKIQFITSYSLHMEPVIKNRLTPFIKMAIEHNFEVQVVSPDKKIFEIEGVSFDHKLVFEQELKPRNFAKRMWFEIRQARKLINTAINFEADYRMITIPSMFLLFNMYLFKKKLVIVDLRDLTWEYVSSNNFIFALTKKLLKILASANLKKSLFINVTNMTEHEYLTKNLRLKNTLVTLVPNGVTQYQFNELSKVTLNTNGPLTIAYIGNVGIGQDLRYFADVAKKFPEINFCIVGAGTDFDSLKDYSIKRNISNLKMTGRLDWNEVKKVYFSAHILYAQLTPDFSMGMPSKLYEYLSTGKFIIYGGKYQAKKALADFDNNIVVDPCNLKALEDAILHLIDSKKYLNLSSSNQSKIKRNFIREKSVSRFFNHLNSLQ